MNLEEYAVELREDVLARADADADADPSKGMVPDAFFDVVSEIVMASGEVENLQRAFCQGAKGSGIRIDGYGEDPLYSGTLDLVVINHNPEEKIQHLTATEMKADFGRARKFVEKSLDEKWRASLSDTSPDFALAHLIATRWSKISKIRLFLVTNRVLSERVDGKNAETFDGRMISFSVWDLRRLHALAEQGNSREIIEINLGEHGGPIPILPALAGAAEHESYLAVLPGSVLASIYDRWNARLLEQNVRVFLQARGNVNRGIRDTLKDNPAMFFAYNNGITATAQAITTTVDGGVLNLTHIQDLQIVNGGQTTASVHAALRAGLDLSRVSVQMKLSIVDAEQAQDVVPAISRFANTQNKVNAADFYSTDGFHLRIKEISERVFAPPASGKLRQTKWFYERARGQAAEARSRLSTAQRKKFDLEHPREQIFTKTDVAKYDMTFRQRPDVVSKGAQKCFADFTKISGDEWTKAPDSINEIWFKNLVSKAIAFRSVERLVSAASWYTGGLRANTVTYALAKLAYDVQASGAGCLDLRSIWIDQSLNERLASMMDAAASAAHKHLLAPAGGSNPTEWAKKQGCWDSFAKSKVDYPIPVMKFAMSADDQRSEKSEGKRDQKVLSGIEAQMAAVQYGADAWAKARTWGREKRLTSEKEDAVLAVASTPSKMLLEHQATTAMAVLKRLRERCFDG